MSGSAAEERIRAKVETAMRAAWPDARIVHELMLEQNGCRIDIAAVTEHRLIVAEIKSERDVLTRLDQQAKAARKVADGFAVIVTEKHHDAAREIVGWTSVWTEDAIEFQSRYDYFERRVLQATTNAPARLNMLWASELRIVAGSGKTAPRLPSIIQASDNLTGAEVRRRVCAALRARHFPRADPPVLGDLFQKVSKA